MAKPGKGKAELDHEMLEGFVMVTLGWWYNYTNLRI